MIYGDAAYKTVDGVQRIGDYFRGIFRGKYNIEDVDNNIRVSRRYPFTGRQHLPMRKKDFSGSKYNGSDVNARLARALESHLKSSTSPEKIEFCADTSGDLVGLRMASCDFVESLRRSVSHHDEGKNFYMRCENWGKIGVLVAACALASIASAGDYSMSREYKVIKNILEKGGLVSLGVGLAGLSSFIGDANLERQMTLGERLEDTRTDIYTEVY